MNRFIGRIVFFPVGHGALASPGMPSEVRRTPPILSKGGTPEAPSIFGGEGPVIDPGVGITGPRRDGFSAGGVVGESSGVVWERE